MAARHVEELRDEKLALPEAANGRVKALRQLFKWARIKGYARTNPALEVTYLESDSDGFHTWTIDQVRQYEACHSASTQARLALALLLFTGVRRSDVVRLGPPMEHTHIAGSGIKREELHFTETKNAHRKVGRRAEGAKKRELPILPELRSVIDATTCGLFTYLVTSFGKPFTANGFGNRFRKWCDEAGLPSECSAHGCRKAGATIAADNGATEHELMAIFGWDSPKQAAIYTRKANRKRLAAQSMHLLVPTSENTVGSKVSHRLAGRVSHSS
jgi:integrase